ncbi:hypothetical protein, partial [Gemmatimonas sp.]|uniref:hypothetical protein n=1 Tax=Gemmatimonas sp. TaxID=1962908 RepID=UPI00286C1ED4
TGLSVQRVFDDGTLEGDPIDVATTGALSAYVLQARMAGALFQATAVTDGSVNATTRTFLSAAEATGLAVTYLGSSARWSPTLDAALNSALAPKQNSRPQDRFSQKEESSVAEQIAAVEAELEFAESTINLALSAECLSTPREPSVTVGPLSPAAVEDGGADCSAEQKAALIESSQFVLAAAALVASLEACGATLGLACVLVPPTYVVYVSEGQDMVEASNKLLACMR